MTIIRTSHNKNKTCILLKKRIFLTHLLSLEAKGLYGVIESLKEEERNFEFLTKLLRISEEKLSNLINDLKDIGVVE